MTLPRLTPDGERALALSTQTSIELGQNFLGVEHLFLALIDVERPQLSRAFASRGADLADFASALRSSLASRPDAGDQLAGHITPRCNEVLTIAGELAGHVDGTAVGSRHLLAAIFREGRSVPLRLMRALELDVPGIREALAELPEPEPEPAEGTPTPMLDRFGRDLTALARGGKLSPVIGREQEMDLVAQVLLRKNKNNPVLVGEPGVGKTAVVEGFAQRLLAVDCPEPLRGRRIVELSLGGLVAGTKYRGEFEERLLQITKELQEHPEIVVFLDEVHALVGAGATGGGDSLDAANIIKPALARGEISCVGATTIAEYRRYIEKDSALERRFEKILIEEPSVEEALEILRRVGPGLEMHHGLRIDPGALEAAVELTVRHVFDRRLPDKALDAVDQSCARKRLERYRTPEGSGAPGGDVVGREDVEATVSQWTGIPLERVSGEAAQGILNLESELRELVLGQEAAVRAVARTILTAKAGLADPKRPMGVFFLAGPTGVGKTHLSKSLAEVLFGDERRLVRVDMSEYMQEHAVSNLIGAPPGYVGHEREGLLISALRTHPHCVVLFDEAEKAHPKVFDLFLQIFDEGRLMGTHGKAADFTQSVVILTSNLDVTPAPARSVGFSSGEEAQPAVDPRATLAEILRPELVNRIDEVIVFERLTGDALRRIVDGYLKDIEERLEERNVRLELTPEVYDHLLQQADTDAFGARELRRLVDRLVRQPLAEKILGLKTDGGVVRVALKEDGLAFETASRSPAL